MAKHPLSTYRLQIRQTFDLDAAAAVTGYLRDLGVSWAYLSPLLRATPGSDHGYDVVDPSLVDPARGGAAGLSRFAASARDAHLGILVDTVPNHMGISLPAENPWWWDVLRQGYGSRYAAAFDIDWDFGGGRVRVPVLGASFEEVLAAGELWVDVSDDARRGVSDSAPSPDGVLRYFEHVLPLAPDSVRHDERDRLGEPDVVRAVLARQHYEPIFWRLEASDLNYRRFFAVTTLAGVRVEVPWVFDETHAEILRWVREGLVDGLRIDHPDGLLDPGAYLDRLADATDSAYVLVEKILEHGESLPAWWPTDGTTGYDAMGEVDRVLIDPQGEAVLDALDEALRTETSVPAVKSWADLIHDTKLTIAETIQGSEVARMLRLVPEPITGAADALRELLACFPVYRSYLPAGREHLAEAGALAARRRPDLAGPIDWLVRLLADPSTEIAQRFQQTTGPVMAKGVEDTAFYRYTRLGALTEVGGDPSVFALSVADFHGAQAHRQASWPLAMTALSTHDTKRGEDVRARLDVLAELPGRWVEVLNELRDVATTGHGPFDNLLWQAIVGSWPATPDRLHAYAEKAAREAAEATGWWDPEPEFEERMHALVDAAFGEASGIVSGFVDEISSYGWSNSLSAKLLQLTGPGVPDVYQGSELWETSLVDPDNRREIDFAARAEMLSRVDDDFARGVVQAVDASAAAKLLVTSRALRLRRDRADLFTRYTPMSVLGVAADHAIAFDRGGAVTVATRLPAGLRERGGWGDTVLLRHAGPTVDALTGRRFEGNEVLLSELLAVYPVALLVPLDASAVVELAPAVAEPVAEPVVAPVGETDAEQGDGDASGQIAESADGEYDEFDADDDEIVLDLDAEVEVGAVAVAPDAVGLHSAGDSVESSDPDSDAVDEPVDASDAEPDAASDYDDDDEDEDEFSLSLDPEQVADPVAASDIEPEPVADPDADPDAVAEPVDASGGESDYDDDDEDEFSLGLDPEPVAESVGATDADEEPVADPDLDPDPVAEPLEASDTDADDDADAESDYDDDDEDEFSLDLDHEPVPDPGEASPESDADDDSEASTDPLRESEPIPVDAPEGPVFDPPVVASSPPDALDDDGDDDDIDEQDSAWEPFSALANDSDAAPPAAAVPEPKKRKWWQSKDQ